MIDAISNGIRLILKIISGVAILGSLSVIVIGLGGSRSIQTPTLLELLGYDGQYWVVLLPSVLILIGGCGLALALRRTGEYS